MSLLASGLGQSAAPEPQCPICKMGGGGTSKSSQKEVKLCTSAGARADEQELSGRVSILPSFMGPDLCEPRDLRTWSFWFKSW